MQVPAELERYRTDTWYLEEHRAELLARYQGQWVAIYKQEVVAADKDPRRLIRQLERKGIPAGEVVREYLTDKEDLLIL